MSVSLTRPSARHPSRVSARLDELDLKGKVVEVLDRWPAAGVAIWRRTRWVTGVIHWPRRRGRRCRSHRTSKRLIGRGTRVRAQRTSDTDRDSFRLALSSLFALERDP